MPWPQTYDDKITSRFERYLDYQDDDNEKSWLALGHEIPSLSGLALELGVVRQTVYNWRDEYPEFGRLVDRLLCMQEVIGLAGGLSGTKNAQIVKMVLAKHGYSDASKVDHVSSDGSMTPKGKTLDDFYQDIPKESDEKG